MLFTQSDIITLLTGIAFVVLLPVIINRLILFIPALMKSWQRSIRPSSLIYHDNLIKPSNLDQGTLDQGTLGTRTFVDRWYGNDTFYSR